jgi:hypothetical protein
MEKYLEELKVLLKLLPETVPIKDEMIYYLDNFRVCHDDEHNCYDEECTIPMTIAGLRRIVYNKTRYKVDYKLSNRLIVILKDLKKLYY